MYYPAYQKNEDSIKARMHRPIFRGFVAESVVDSDYSIQESADYSTDSVIDGRLPLSNMFNILKPMEFGPGL